MPSPTPQPASTVKSCQVESVRLITGSSPATTTYPAWTIRRGATEASAAPVAGIATIAPTAGPSSAKPRLPGERCSLATTAGIRAAQVAVVAPRRKNAAVIIACARRVEMARLDMVYAKPG